VIGTVVLGRHEEGSKKRTRGTELVDEDTRNQAYQEPTDCISTIRNCGSNRVE